MLSTIRRSVMSPRVSVWRSQQRALSYTAVGQQLGGRGAAEAESSSWGAGHEFDGDAGDYVSKEVSIHDRQHVARSLSGAEAIAAQERDYSDSRPSTACWGRDDESAAATATAASATIPKPFAHEYEQPLEQGHMNKQQTRQ